MGLFDEEEDFLKQGGVPEYGRPSSTFSEESQASTYSPAMERNFRQLQSNLDYRKGVRENASSSKQALSVYENDLRNWEESNIGKAYFNTIGSAAPKDLNGGQVLDQLKSFGQNLEGFDVEGVDRLQKEWGRRNANLESYRARDGQIQNELASVESFNSMVSPAFRTAYDNWQNTTGGRKPNGSPSKLMDPKRANEVLDFLNFRKPTAWEETSPLNLRTRLDEIDPRYEVKGEGGTAERLNKKQFERRKSLLQGDFDSLFGEHERASKIRGSGMHIAPSWQNQIAGVDRILGSQSEREAVLVAHAKEAGLDYFTDSAGNRRDIGEYIASSEYSPEEIDALKMMNALGQARTKFNDLSIKFWSSLKDVSKKEDSDAWNELELVRNQRDQFAQSLAAMGYGRDIFSRAESIQDVGMISGWVKTGGIQEDIADFSDNLVGDPSNMSTKDFEQLSRFAAQQDYLGELMQKNGNSPLANLMAMSEKEKDGWLGAVGRWFSMDGVKALGELVVTNLSGFLPEYFDTAPAVVGGSTLTGALVGGGLPGAATGFSLGLKANWGVASVAMEYAANVLEGLKEEGVDIHNPKVFAAAWANESLRQKVQKKAGIKAGVVGLFDTVSAGMAGKVNAVLKSPSTLTKIPSSFLPKNKNLSGLSVEGTQRLKELRRRFKKNEFQDTSKEFAELQKLESGLSNKVFSTQTPFSKAIDNANARVDRTTGLMRAKNAAVELGFGGATGAAGEGFGQLLSREPGEAFDKQAVIAEFMGEVGGPGTIGAAMEVMRSPDLRLTQSVKESSRPIAPTNDPKDPYGYTGQGLTESMNNNGWKYEKVGFENSVDSVSFLAKAGNLPLQINDNKGKQIDNPEIQFLKEFVTGVEGIMKRKNLQVKYVVSDRTPEGSGNIGYQKREGNDYVVYINQKALNQKGSSIGSALIHELPHVVGTGFYGDAQVEGWYNQLSKEQQLQALSHYMFKDTDPNTPINQLNDKQQTELNQEYAAVLSNPEAKARAAQEWFSFEFARVLASGIKEKGQSADITDATGIPTKAPSALPAGINNDILDFVDQYIYPMYKKYIGSGQMVMPDVAGNRAAFTDGGAKPEKMAPEQMYAQILYDMNWGGMGPGGDIAYQGADKPRISRASSVADMPSLFANQNKLIDDARTMGPLMKVAGDPGFERVKVGKNEQDISVAPDPDSISTPEDILSAFETQVDQEKQSTGLPSEPASFTPEQEQQMRTNLEKQFDRQVLKSQTETDPNILKGDKAQDTASALKDVATKEGPIATSRKKLDRLNKALEEAQNKNKSAIRYQGEERTLEEIRNIISEEEANLAEITAPVEKAMEAQRLKLNTKQKKEVSDGKVSFKPDILTNQKGEAIANPATKKETINLAQRSRDEVDNFVKLVVGKTKKRPEQIAKDLDKALQAKPEDLKPKLEKIAKQLLSENKRVTTEEVYSRFVEDLGVPILAETNKRKARALLSENAEVDPESIDEAYAQMESTTEELMGTIDKSIQGLDLEVQAEEKLQSQMEISEAPKLEEGKDTLNDSQVTGLVKSIKALFQTYEPKEGSQESSKKQINDFLISKLKGDPAKVKEIASELTELIQSPGVLSDTKDIKSKVSGISKKLDVLIDPAVTEQTSETSVNAVDMSEKRARIRELLSSGAVTGLDRDASLAKIAKSKEKVSEKKAESEKLKDLKTAISLGTDAGNIDYRDTPVDIKIVPDDKSIKGTDFGQMVTSDNRKVTLGDLAANDKLKVKYSNDSKGKTFTINGPQYLDKLADNYNWENDQAIVSDFESRNPGVSYAEYGTRLLAAIASRRPGATIQTKRGPVTTSFFSADQGISKTAMLFEKIERLGKALRRNAPENSFLSMMEPYEVAIKRQEREAKALRDADPVYAAKKKQLDTFYDLIVGPDREGKKKGDFEDLRKIIESKNFARIKDDLIADKENNSLELSMLKQIEDLVKKKRKLKKKITVADGRELLGLGTKQMSEGSRKVERPIPMLSKDLLNLNLTAARIAEQFLSEDSENIGVVMYNKRVADFALSVDANLLNDLAVVNELINTGVGPRTTLSEGANIIKGDLFPFRNRLYRAHKSFQVTSESIQKIDEYANPAERLLPDDHRGVEKLTEKQLKKLEISRNNILKALKRLGSLSRNQFFPSDALSQRPTVTDQAGNPLDVSASALDILSGPIETKQYKHLVSMAYEYAAERGVNRSYMQKMPTKSKGKSHMEHTHVEDFLAKSDFNKALVERQAKGIQDNLMSLPEAAKRALDMLVKQQKKSLETDTYVDYDPEGLDAPLNLAKEWVNALNNAEPKVQRLLGVKDAKGKMVYDMAEILKTPYLKKQFDDKMEDIKTLSRQGGLPLHFDNMKFKSDPVVSALSADPDQHNFVRDALRAEALKEGKRETERYTVTVSKPDVKRIFKDTSLAKSGTFSTVSKSNKNNFEFTFDPQMDRDVKVTFQKSTFFDPRFEDLRNFDRSSPANRVLLRKGEKLVLNGSRYTVKQNIDLKSEEGQELLAITSEASFNSNRPLSSSAPEFQRLFDSKSKLFSKAKANSKVQDAVVSKDNEYIADALNTLKKAKERKDQELKSIMSDPRSGNPELVGNLEKTIKELDGRISSVENFFDNPDPKSWDLLVEHQGNFVKTSVKKEGGEFKLYYKEKGNFINPKTGRAVGTEVSNKLFNLLRVKYDLNFDSPDGSKRNAAIEAMSSFSTTPRELVTRLIDIGGVENIGMLSSSHSKYYADSVGGIMLLEYLDSAPDKLLASLEKSGGVDKIIKNLREKVDLFQNPKGLKGMNKVDFDQLSSDLEFFEKVKESGIKLQDAAIINYVSEFKINRLKNSPAITQDKKISAALTEDDKNLLSDLINDDNPDSVFRLATRTDLKLKNNQPIKLGRVEAKKDADGNVVTKARDIFGVVKVRSVDEDGSVVKLDLSQKPEDFDISTDRWPKVSKKAQKEDAGDTYQKAFLYDIEIQELQSDSEQSIKNLLYESEKQKFIDFKPEERKLASSLSESLSKLAESPEKKYIELSRQALKAYSKADYVYQQDRSLHEDIVDDIVNGDKMLKSKLRFLTRSVFHMGGMRISTAEDIIAEQRAIDKEANRYSPDSENISGDGQSSGPQKTEDEANPENVPDSGGAGWEKLFDKMDDDSYVDPGLSSNYSTSMFSRTRGPRLLSLFSDAFTRRYNLWKNKKINEKLEDNELDLGKGALRGHTGIYGKFVEQFGPFLKLEKSLMSALNTDDKGLRAKGLKAYDKFYQGMGMSGALLDEGNRLYVNPVKDALYESQADLQDVGWYLYALTAPQANAAIKENREKRMGKKDIVDPDTGESMGSGMTNSQAQEIIDRLEGNSNMAKFIMHRNNPVKALFDMHRKSLELMRESELIDTGSYDRMRGAASSKFKFKHRLGVNFGDFRRLPLKGVFGDDAQYQNAEDIADILSGTSMATGKGFDMPRGPFKMAATGREYNTLADINTIFGHVTQDYSDAVIRSMRSKSANAINNIYNELFAEKEAGNTAAADLFKRLFADNQKKTAKVSSKIVNGIFQIDELEVPAEIKDPSLALFVKEDGESKLIMFSDKSEGALLASAAKNLTYEQLGTWIGYLNMTTKYMSRIRTSYSPEFWLRNPIKDTMTAWFNLKESKEFSDIAGKVANPLRISQDALGIMKYEKNIDKYGKVLNGLDKMEEKELRNLAKTDITAAYHLLEKHGGKTAFYKFESVPEIMASMKNAAKEGREGNVVKRNLKVITSAVDRLNTSLENVLRARVIMEGLKAGKDFEALITQARNVTVDFNKRGTMSQQLNAVFQFANPGIQGGRRFAKALAARGAVGSANIAMKIAMLSFTYNALVRALTARGDEENDDYSSYLDDVSARQRHTGMVIPHRLFGDDRKAPGYTHIPIGIGPHSFWALGDYLAKTWATNGRHSVRDSLELASSMWQTMSPISSYPIPALDPFLDLLSNQKFTGSPIYLEDVPGAPSESSQKNTPKIYNEVSDWINAMAGGDKDMPGSMMGFLGKDPIEVSGQFDFALDGKFSGSGIEFFVKQYGGSLADNIAQILNLGFEQPSKLNIPVLKGVVKTQGSAYSSIGKYYDLRERYIKAKAKIDSLLGAEKKAFLADEGHKHYVRLIQVMNSAENQMNMYTRRKRVLEAKEQTPAVIQQIEKLDEIRINTIRGVLGKALDMGLDV